MSEDEKLSQPSNLTPPPNEAESSKKENLLIYMAQRAAHRSFYMASALASFRQVENLDEAGLLRYLDIEPPQLTRLALCGRPDVNDKTGFAADVKAIATKFNVKPVLLAKLLRAVAAYESNREITATSDTVLMAALDRENDDAETEADTHD